MTDPTFLVIGAQKCGTSWLSEMIRQHPEVCAPVKKELHFFSSRQNYNKGIEWYRSHFQGCLNHKAVGEFTPNYFWTSTDIREIEESNSNRDIPSLIYNHFPDIRLIVSLRNPVDRAVSGYYHQIRARRISPRSSILDAKDRYGILTMGFYHIHLTRWYEVFHPDRFLILIYEEDIVQNKEVTLKKVYRFIGVDDAFRPRNPEVRFNPRANHFRMRVNYYAPLLYKILVRILPSRLINSEFWNIPVHDEEIKKIKSIFLNHNEKLSGLIGRKLPW